MKYKLSEICSGITDGSHNPPTGVGFSEYLMLSSKNVFDDEITYEEPRYLSEEQFATEHKRTEIKSNDVLMTIVGTIGRTAIVTDDMPPITLQRSVAVLHPIENICLSRYLMYELRSKRRYFESEAHGVAQKGIYLKQLSNIIVDIPDKQCQIERVQILDQIQSIIKKRSKEISKLDGLIKARFVEMFGDPATNPLGWTETTVGRECYYIKDGPHKSLPDIGKESGGHPFISVRNIVNHVIDFSTAKYVSDEDYAEARKKCCPEKGDMLYSKGGTTGIAKLIDVDIEFANWVHLAVLKFDHNVLDGIYFENMLNSGYCYDQSQRLTKGIANRDLVLSAMAQIKMYRPPIGLQKQFADFVKQVDKSKAGIQKSLNEMQLLFDSLMQQYFG